MYYTYILKSSKSHHFYFGWTTDLQKRIKEHNQGLNRSTKPGAPWVLMFYAAFPKQRQAKDFERYLKSGSGKSFAYKRLLE